MSVGIPRWRKRGTRLRNGIKTLETGGDAWVGAIFWFLLNN